MEACGTFQYWARTAQSLGHDVKLLHAQACVRRTKTDAADADALIPADRHDSLHTVPVDPKELQALQGMHRIREQWKRTRTARISEARALLPEFGVLIPFRAREIGKQLTRLDTRAVNTQARVGHNKATVALANKMARIMWAVWIRYEIFNGDDALHFAA